MTLFWERLALAPVLLLASAIGALYYLNLQAAAKSYTLLTMLNLLFCTPVALLVAYLSARGYLFRGEKYLLLMGSSMLAWGLTTSLVGVVGNSTNAQWTFHGIGTCFAGLACLAGAVSTCISSRPGHAGHKPSDLILAISYVSITIFLIFIAWSSAQRMLPPFFVRGHGQTILRQVVLGIAAAQFLAAFIIFRFLYARTRLAFFHWYSLGLVLIDAGLIGMWITKPGTPLNWAVWGAQLLAGPYILTAVLSVRSKLREWSLPIETALQESEERYKDLVESSNSVIMRVDKDLNITYMNEFGLRYFGYTAKELIGKNVIGTTVPVKDDDGRDLSAMAKDIVKRPDRYQTNAHKNMRKSGELVWVSWTNKVKYDKDGNVLEILAIGNDISLLKKAEAALRESEERFRLFMDNSPGIAWIKDEEGRYLYLSKSFEARFEGKIKDWRMKNDFELWPEEIARKFQENDRAVLKDGQHRQIIEEARFSDGTQTFWLNSKFLITDASGRRFIGGSGVDVTERLKAEESLSNSRCQLELAQRASGAGIWDWDMQSGRLEWSSELFTLFGLGADKTKATFDIWRKALHPEDLAAAEQRIADAVKNGRQLESEYRVVYATGEVRWISALGSTVYDDHLKPVRMRGICLDITERKRAECILKRDKEIFEKIVQEKTKEIIETQMELERAKRLSDIGVLAATVAHELRNPLAAIAIAGHNIKRKVNNPDIDKHLANIDKKVTESDQIINNLLFYSRLKPPQHERVDVSDIIEECIYAIKKQSKKEVKVANDLGPIKGVRIEADPLQMREVFNNILNNACDAAPPQNGKIKIMAETRNEFITVSVHDNGPGIEKAILDKVFDPFFTTKAKGTGLGLSVCRQIVDFHNGTISIESEAGQGTVVTVSLPRYKNTAQHS